MEVAVFVVTCSYEGLEDDNLSLEIDEEPDKLF